MLIYINVNMVVIIYESKEMFSGVLDVLRVAETQLFGNLMITFDVKGAYLEWLEVRGCAELRRDVERDERFRV